MNHLRTLAGILLASLLLTGCEFSVYKLPLPGGADVGDDPIVVTATFRDVLDLVPQSTVKYNDVTVGKVTDVKLDGYDAEVEMTIRNDVEIPENAYAEIRQTSLLGEKFVSLGSPEDAQGRLEDGAEIGLDDTSRNPEVEEVLGALSLLLNGGGVAQLKTIAHELNLALEGRESSARSVLQQIRSFTGQLDANKGDIVNAIEALNRLAISANRHRGDIESALDNLPAALQSLDRQREDLIRMLEALGELGDVGTRVIEASRTATINTLRQLNPVLTELADAGDDLANAFHVFLTYPFVDEVVGRDPQVARNLHMGDYTNLAIQLDIDLGNPTIPGPPPHRQQSQTPGAATHRLGDVQSCLAGNNSACQRVLTSPQQLDKLRDECAERVNRNRPVCTQLRAVSGGGGGGGISLPSFPGLPLPRAAFGNTTTLDQLMGRYNPILVQALLPGVAR